jgi:phosphoribosyl 1,2-cyclic phosphate phosphodiesterase
LSPQAAYPTRARVQLMPLEERNPVHGVDFVRVPVFHGERAIVGYRFGKAAYLTDVSAIPEASFALLEGVEVLAISALRHTPHPSHSTVEQSLAWSRRIGARQTWFTHIAHDLGHEETNRSLPAEARLAYDGLSVPVTL